MELKLGKHPLQAEADRWFKLGQLTNLQGDEPPVPERMLASVTAEKKLGLWTVMETATGTAELHRNNTVEGGTAPTQHKIKQSALF